MRERLPTTAQRSRIMARIRGGDTKPEMLVRRLLHALGYRYRLHARHLPGCPDLVFSSRRKAIFVNGCFWHLHHCLGARLPRTNSKFWKTKLRANVQRDHRVRRQLTREGWHVLTIWECQMGSPRTLTKRLIQFLEKGGLR